ncbi:hypothetical protein QWY99_20990 [Flavobacterium branchiarum]|uniref:Bacteriocin n=1 Tax=Flavobacterium branchiarum TaxID=1114870 RepID=A0ABV5FPH2_9FLAO|nr:hypothetical protein [Flavobacterium branchiarum]MDN3675512.1 hypothetical protein [Flavobacterium branchiarum]
MNLENLNLVELNAQEVQEVEGGNIFRAVQYLLEFASIYDAVSDFKEGWNSVPSTQRGAQGSW